MKNKKLLLTSLLLLAPALTGCGRKFNIGICQLVKFEALDLATEGFKKAVIDGLGEENVTFYFQDANNDVNTCAIIANSFVSKGVDLIMANATPALQAAYNSTEQIPILATSITEYGVALGIDDFDGVTNTNVSGTSDLAPLDEQAEMLLDIFPDVEKVGLLYCSSEPNSKYQVEEVEKELKQEGIQTTRITFSDSNDISAALNGRINEVDAIYIPTDNTCASNAKIINSICTDNMVPVFAGEEGICKKCGAITLSISYYNIGLITGQMAVDILKNGADIKKMPIRYDEQPVKKYNPELCELFELDIPEDYKPLELE